MQNVDRIRGIPTHIVHGRYDIICPMAGMFELTEAWPEASFTVVPDAGHSSHEPGIAESLVAATDRVRETGSPHE